MRLLRIPSAFLRNGCRIRDGPFDYSMKERIACERCQGRCTPLESYQEKCVKYVCFGYLDVKSWESKSESERSAMLDACFAYDDTLKKNGHWVSGEGLQGPGSAATLRYRDGKVAVTDGPYAETKELLGGLLILEARDLKHAVELISSHPGTKMGPWEIRPVADLTQMVRESEKRRSVAK
jgi:hypothetical protein